MATAEPKKGANRGNAGKGRPKGSQNKENKALREMILQALDDQPGGGIEYLKLQAMENPASFMTLLGKVLPMQLTGDAANPVVVTRIELVPMSDDSGKD